VRYNLHSALQALRYRWSKANISWRIDAICINQRDVPERNEPVTHMKDIYSNYGGRVILLGPPDAIMHTAFSKIMEVSASRDERKESLKVSNIMDEDTNEYGEIVKRDFHDEESVMAWDSLRHFMLCSWWKRAWVVQEICLAPDDVVRAGN
jgi:hypothetical protein